MSIPSIGRLALLFAIFVAAFAALASPPREVTAEPYVQGPSSCKECHRDEYKTWEETKHFKSYRTAHKAEDAKKISIAVSGKKNMKRNKNCTVCHYSNEQKKPEDKSKIKYGPACESCHGASSAWESIHFDYGGPSVKQEAETSDHKAKRIADANAAGLIWSSMNYDIAANCMKCHGLARADVSGEAFGKMLEAGHPINQSFEAVMFSQGLMRHWRDKRSSAKLAQLFVAGQAAKLVSATEAAANSEDAKYKAVQSKRADDAKAALQSVPQAAALIQSPSDANARKMMQDIGQKDLSGVVGGQIPCAGPDKANLWQC
jgi:hypothetical protein